MGNFLKRNLWIINHLKDDPSILKKGEVIGKNSWKRGVLTHYGKIQDDQIGELYLCLKETKDIHHLKELGLKGFGL